MMASERWLTTTTIMLQQADRMRRTHPLHLAARIFRLAGNWRRRTENLSGVIMQVEEIEALIEELTEADQETNELWDELMNCSQDLPFVECFMLLSVHGLPLIYYYLENRYNEWRIRRLTALANTLRNQFLA